MKKLTKKQVDNLSISAFLEENLRKGVQGQRIKIEPEKEQSMLLSNDSLIQRGKVIGHGPNSPCNVGDIVIVSDWLVERIVLGDQTSFYVPYDAILEIV